MLRGVVGVVRQCRVEHAHRAAAVRRVLGCVGHGVDAAARTLAHQRHGPLGLRGHMGQERVAGLLETPHGLGRVRVGVAGVRVHGAGALAVGAVHERLAGAVHGQVERGGGFGKVHFRDARDISGSAATRAFY
jgi:hypothetical protein